MTERVLIGLGSNLGDRAACLRRALTRLDAHPHVDVLRTSGFYETSPVGGPPQGDFLNACALVVTDLEPPALLRFLEGLERDAGRVRRERDGPRTLDLDILLFGDRIIEEPGLRIPHPRMAGRGFVLVPAREVAPDAVHPGLGIPVRDLPLPDGDDHEVRAFHEAEVP